MRQVPAAQVIIEGFKTYKHRTVLGEPDTLSEKINVVGMGPFT